MAVINPEKLAESVADAAAEIITPRFRALEDYEISSKGGPSDLVTAADLEMEERLKRILPEFLPGSIVIGEEGISTGEDSLETLKDDTQKIFLVDPIDGTRNFVNGDENFAVMIACIIGGKTALSWIYDVLQNTFYIAEKSSGAYKNEKKLSIGTPKPIAESIAHINYRYFPKGVRVEMEAFIAEFKENRSLGSSAHEYMRLADGTADISFYSESRIWDNIPGTLLVEEAGGYVKKANSTPLYVFDDMANVIAAGNEELWREMHQKLTQNPVFKPYFE